MVYGTDSPIIIWVWEQYAQLANEAVERYIIDANPDVQISVVAKNFYEIYTFLENYSTEEELPNIILVDDGNIKNYVKAFKKHGSTRNLFAPLNKYLGNLDSGIYFRSKLAHVMHSDGCFYGFPLSCSPCALYYNKIIFQELGYTQTDLENLTWDNLIQIGEKLRAEDVYLLPHYSSFLQILLQSSGVSFYNDMGEISAPDSILSLIQLIQQLSNLDLLWPTVLSQSELVDLFQSGKIACFIKEPRILSELENFENLGFVEIPKQDDYFTYNVDLSGLSWMVIDKGSVADKKYVFDFLKYMFGGENPDESFVQNLVNEYKLVPATYNAINVVNNSGFYATDSHSEAILFLLNLMPDIPETYYGVFTNDLITNLQEKIERVLYDDDYTEDEAVFDFNVACDGCKDQEQPLILIDIEIISPPDKTSYMEYDYFEPSGLTIRAYFSDGSEIETEAYEYYPNELSSSDQFVTVGFSSGGVTKTRQQPVNVTNRIIESISVTSRSYFLHGSYLSKGDFSVQAIYQDGFTRSVYNFEYPQDCLSELGEVSITISYSEDGRTISSTKVITVVKKLISVHIASKPDKLLYSGGERFISSGLQLTALYSDDSTAVIGSGKIDYKPAYVKFANGEDNKNIELSYTERGITKTVPLTVYKKTGMELDQTEIAQDMGNSGAGAINLSNGELKYIFNDYTGIDKVTPISVAHIFKDGFSNDSCYGKNWRLNIQQEIKKNNERWEYTDKEGKTYTFDNGYENTKDRSSIRCERLGLDLFYNQQNNVVKLVDRDNNTFVFSLVNYIYRLTEIHQFPSTVENIIPAYSTNIEYFSDGKIAAVKAGKIVNNNRATLLFNYTDNLLSSLVYRFGNETIIANYFYDKNELIRITRCHNRVNHEFSLTTEFVYANDNISTFKVIDKSSKDSQNNYKQITYLFDESNRVDSFETGYGNADKEKTEIRYTALTLPVETSTNVVLSTYTIKKNTVSVASFSTMGAISQYSFDVSNQKNEGYYKPIKINNAQSRGFDYFSLADTYSDLLDLYHDEFENNSLEDWSGATHNSERCVYGTSSICGYNLQKTFTLTSDKISNNTTVYLSLWAYAPTSSETKITLTITDAANRSSVFTHSLDKKLNLWQYTAFSLGKRKIGDKIEIKISSSAKVYLDEVRLVKAPYETPDDIGETVYDSFGKPLKSYNYNPIDGKISCTECKYNNVHQLTTQTETVNNTTINKTENSYNNGLLVSSKQYGSSYYYTEQNNTYDADSVLIATNDENNVSATYSESVDQTQINIAGETGSPSSVSKNLYFSDSDVLKEISVGSCKNAYLYCTDGSMQKVQYAYSDSDGQYNSDIEYIYDTFGNIKQVRLGGIALITLDYSATHLNSATYANGDSLSYEYDDKNRIKSIKENGVSVVSIAYSDTNDNFVIITHANALVYESRTINKNGITYQYEVKNNNVIKLKAVNKAAASVGNVSTTEYYIDNSDTPFERCVTTKDRNGQNSSVQRSYHGGNTAYLYDRNDRLQTKTTTFTTGQKQCAFKVEFNYVRLPSDRVGTLITDETLNINNSQKDSYQYEYYINGNIKHIYSGDVLLKKYVYDEYDRLIWEYNYDLLKAHNYSYDSGGNITEKKSYLITGGEVESAPFKTDVYEYSAITENAGQNAAWKDQLKSYNGNAIVYDASGNPTDYLGKTMLWNGRRLKQIDSVALDYDYNGLRVKKADRDYYWLSGNLMLERWGENYIYYFYDDSGVCGFNYNGTDYYYRKNTLGDVLAIYDKFGNLKCRYVYDAWGNHKIYDESGNELLPESINIGNINSIRYRSYYWDKEFGLYYLQSRYYDPALGRFISPDSMNYLSPDDILGLNLYCYCSDNPVMNIDPTGTWSWGRFFKGVAIVAAAAAAIALTVATFGTGSAVGAVIIAGTIGAAGNLFSQTVIEDKSFSDANYLQVALAGAAGAASAIPGVNFVGAIAISGVQGYLSSRIDGNSRMDAVCDALMGAGITAIAGGITRAIGLSKISKLGKGKYANKKIFLKHVQSNQLKRQLSSFNPSINKTQTLMSFIKNQVGIKGLSKIASDTAGSVINTISDIITSIIP